MYKLPNGDVTDDSHVYFKAWDNLAETIGRATNSTVCGFDPDIAFYDPDRPNAQMARLPVWFAVRLARALNEKGKVEDPSADIPF